MSSLSQELHGLFNDQLKTYEKVVSLDLMDHQAVYGLLRDELASSAPERFTFLDVACGSASASARALAGLPIGNYIGIDTSEPSLRLAAHHLASLGCPCDLRCLDFVEALRQWDEPVDVVWIGQSLHHLDRPGKTEVIRRIGEILPRDGLFMLWEPTLLGSEDRADWLARFRADRPFWRALSDEEFGSFISHMDTSDFPEAADDWLEMGRDAGFERCDELYVMRNKLGRFYRFRHT